MNRIDISELTKDKIYKDKFIANKVFPIGIRNLNNSKNYFVFLFALYEDYSESYKFVQMMFVVNNAMEYEYITNCPFYLKNIANDKEKLEFYNSMIKILTEQQLENGESLYSVDFADMYKSKDFPIYYETKAIKNNPLFDGSEGINLYFTRENYIRLSMFVYYFSSCKQRKKPIDELFTDERLNNIEFVSIEKVKICETTRIKADKDSDQEVNLTHYVLNCGPTEFAFSIISLIPEEYKDKKLNNPIDNESYFARYDKDIVIDFYLTEKDSENMIILYLKEDVNKALVIKKELYNHTNIVDYTNNIYVED